MIFRGEENCPKPIVPHVVTEEEKELLTSSTFTVASKLNKNENWVPSNIQKMYKGAAIQTSRHVYHERYRCQGPYHKKWGLGAASWHPSVSGHEMRAYQYSYFWLSIWKDAIVDLIKEKTANNALITEKLLLETSSHLSTLLAGSPIPTKTLYPTNFSLPMSCFTDFQPRHDPASSLTALVLSGLSGPGSWRPIVLESLLNGWKSIIQTHRKQEYLDYKNILVADPGAAPLHLKIAIGQTAPMFLCEPTGFFGKPAATAEHFWILRPKVYITATTDYSSFVFTAEKATQLDYFHVTSTGGGDGEVCVQTAGSVTAGQHVLTIVPTHTAKLLMLATLVLP